MKPKLKKKSAIYKKILKQELKLINSRLANKSKN